MTRLVREFLRRIRGRYCIDCVAAKLALPALEVRVAFSELGNELTSPQGDFEVSEGTCAACGRLATTATFTARPITTQTPTTCAWCHNALGVGGGVAVLNNDGHMVKVHMVCLRKFRASRFNVN